MKAIVVFALIALVAFAADVQEDEGVLVLTEANFDQVISQNEFVLVEFYAPWCGHCKKLKPEYEKAAATLKGLEKPVPLAKVDATENQELGSRFGVQGYPTIKFFTNGSPIDYTGGRTDKEIVSWIQKRVGHISTELKDQAALDKFRNDNSVVVVYFGNSESDANWNVFKSAAMSLDKISFGHVFNADVAAHEKAGQNVVLFKKFDEGRNDYAGAWDLQSLKTWIDEKSFATVMEFDDRAIEKVFQQGNPTIFLFVNKNENSVAARANFEAAAKQLKGGRVIFSLTHPDDGHGHFQRLADYLGVNTAQVPQIMLIHATQDVAKFQYSGDFSTQSITKFVNDFNAGSLSRFLKSEEIPASNPGPVKVLVGKSFKSEVLDNSKDVLVKFYAPWCGHCKSLAPEWEKAAEQLKDFPNIVIAKLDSTTNEVEGVSIKGFPTLKFYPGNDKSSPIDYDGDRTADAIVNWVKSRATQPSVTPKGNDDL